MSLLKTLIQFEKQDRSDKELEKVLRSSGGHIYLKSQGSLIARVGGSHKTCWKTKASSGLVLRATVLVAMYGWIGKRGQRRGSTHGGKYPSP